MPFYLHICQDNQHEPFLLISEQQIDGSLPEIKAQVFYEQPDIDFNKDPIKVATYGIARKEVEELLNFALQRSNASNKSTGLFTKGKLDKKSAFRIQAYSSVKEVTEILDTLGLSSPSKAKFLTRKMKKDQEHVLDHKHRIFWQEHVPLLHRKNLDPKKWTELEIKETYLLNKLNIINLILTEVFRSLQNDIIDEATAELLSFFKKGAEDIQNDYGYIQTLKEQATSGSPEDKKALFNELQDYLDRLDVFTTDLLKDIYDNPSLANHPLLAYVASPTQADKAKSSSRPSRPKPTL